ncbi:MAG: filamentous hemagglutinin N-terminal domain-containing protein [Cyanobacteria bacterium J06635_1]
MSFAEPSSYMTMTTPLKLPCLTLLALGVALQGRAIAQVIPDGTLGVESSQLFDVSAVEQLIRGGALRDENLFHSFEQFSIGEGGQVTFDNPAAVQRVFSRVTGDLPSEIFGTLGSTGTADVYFLNPNGIVFGPNARLNVGGSFVASTADTFEFADSGVYSARNPEVPSSLLTILPSALQFGQVLLGEILVQSTADNQGLQVSRGESLVLLGGPVTVDGGFLTAEEGRVEVGAAQEGSIQVALNGQLTFAAGLNRESVTIKNDAFVNVALGNSGDIQITARDIEISDSALNTGISQGLGNSGSQAGDVVLTATESIRIIDSPIFNDVGIGAVGNSGNIRIIAPTVEVQDGGQFSAIALGEGDAGSVIINASDSVTFTGETETGAPSSAFSIVAPGGSGSGGDIEIITAILEVLNGAVLSASAFGEGDAGSIIINASESVTFAGEGESGLGSGAFSAVEGSAAGSGGKIEITTSVLVMLDGAQLSASAFGEGDAGIIIINASDRATFAREDSQGLPSGAFSSVGENGVGRGGDIEIITSVLEVLDGAQIGSGTFGEGNAGNVIINAGNRITFSGEDNEGFPSGAFSSVEENGIGNGGDIEISTFMLEVLNGAEISAETLGEGNSGTVTINSRSHVNLNQGGIVTNSASLTGRGGDIAITTPLITLVEQSEILTQTVATDGGNITLNLDNLLVLTDNSIISTEAGTAGAGGDGGDIDINTQFIATRLSENSDIVANAFDGDGGNVDIAATDGIFGIVPRPLRTPQSDITASSRNGVSGDIAIQSPDVDPNESTTELPTALDAPDVIQSCREAYVQSGSEFVVTGRGGLPQGPLDSASTTLWQDVLPIESNNPVMSEPAALDFDETAVPAPIVEVQGWIKNAQGQIVLVAEDPQQATIGQPLACQG